MEKVQGYCPMGCGRTLFLGVGGYVTCSYIQCPKPDAVVDILADRESEHIVILSGGTFSIKHPLRERVDGDLFDCLLDRYLRQLDGPPLKPGTYRARRNASGSWRWEEVHVDG